MDDSGLPTGPLTITFRLLKGVIAHVTLELRFGLKWGLVIWTQACLTRYLS